MHPSWYFASNQTIQFTNSLTTVLLVYIAFLPCSRCCYAGHFSYVLAKLIKSFKYCCMGNVMFNQEMLDFWCTSYCFKLLFTHRKAVFTKDGMNTKLFLSLKPVYLYKFIIINNDNDNNKDFVWRGNIIRRVQSFLWPSIKMYIHMYTLTNETFI
jgi:hypothetical protein